MQTSFCSFVWSREKKTPLDALEFAIVLTSTDKCNYVKTFGKVQVLLKFMLIKLQD